MEKRYKEMREDVHPVRLSPYPSDQAWSRHQMSYHLNRIITSSILIHKHSISSTLSLLVVSTITLLFEIVPVGSTSLASLMASDVAMSWLAGEMAKIILLGYKIKSDFNMASSDHLKRIFYSTNWWSNVTFST